MTAKLVPLLLCLLLLTGCPALTALIGVITAPQPTPTPGASMTPLPRPTASPAPDPTATPTPQPSRCTGQEIICLDHFDDDLLALSGAVNYGGDFRNGAYQPTAGGGLLLPFTLDTSRPYRITIEITGGLANWQAGELTGGKVALFTLEAKSQDYWLMLQRMDGSEFGGGRLRGYFAVPDNSNPSNLITSPLFQSDYTTAPWGTEAHRLTVHVSGHAYQLEVDEFRSVWGELARSPVALGVKAVTVMVGNYHARLPTTHAVTWFTSFVVAYE